MWTIRPIALLTGFLAATATVSSCVPREARPSEFPIYSAVLEKLEGDGTYPRLLVRDETVVVMGAFQAAMTSGPVKLEVPQSLWKDFENANQTPISLRDSLPQLTLEYLPAAFQRADSTDLLGYWQEVREEFGDGVGVVGLSRPAFTRDGSTALIYFEIGLGDLAGEGRYALLRWDGTIWRVVEDVGYWVS